MLPAAGMDEDATQYHIRLAVDHARDYNDLFDALSTWAEAGSVRPQAPVIDRGHKEELRVNLQMPERYNGMYLTDEVYEMWNQYAPKQIFEEDGRIMLQMLARRPADALLDNFHDLRWAPRTNFASAKAELRHLQPTRIEEMVDIISDYAPATDLTSASSPAVQQVDAKLQKVLAAVATSTSPADNLLQQLTDKVQGIEKQLQSSQSRRP
ncbi:hypothetical protein Pmar_PMAR015992 [Perkinsus marinus ATCC 50983]|uniref:Uncharacterized protein n=1 Tax=Perkinsus marinus (strain ATCC 50983 / TXsc) TaxID=423536 RepID=C5KKZ9_PERM5|nr:hypothetical protein Pmar_PMAR015992 [Perkinsus marinus ATCC 50983]EER14844.1 hypothetical protein Pmar_PMAR015992 [Perkinsus marinus ATCC 50983]|eukprot:XP_002783048.1 hypothetical protein Pmar_PMAR015992 [Perkinsus marinus ATCC 50983]